MDLEPLLRASLIGLLHELVDGPSADMAFVVNPGDPGLLRSLARVSAADASSRPNGRSSVAAHVQHLRFGFSLLNRWIRGDERAFADATFAESWSHQQVDADEWTALREALGQEVRDWIEGLSAPRQWEPVSMGGAIGSVAHLAYHVGAIRQLLPAAAGPPARD